MRPLNGGARDRGLTLIELAVAILVLSLGSLAALRAADQSRVAIGGALPRLMAEEAARNRIEELRLFGPQAALPDRIESGGQGIALTTEHTATEGGFFRVTVTASSDAGPGAVLSAYLPAGVGR